MPYSNIIQYMYKKKLVEQNNILRMVTGEQWGNWITPNGSHKKWYYFSSILIWFDSSLICIIY